MMVDVFAVRFRCANSEETHDKPFYINDKTTRDDVNLSVGLRIHTASDTVIFFSKSAANIAAPEILKICNHMYPHLEEAEIIVEKVKISADQASYIVNQPTHWLKKL